MFSKSITKSFVSRPMLSRFGARQLSIANAVVSEDRKYVQISWDNGVTGKFSSMWLCDHSPDTLHPTSKQRQLDSASIDPDIAVENVEVANNRITINWAPGKREQYAPTTYYGDWLRDHHVETRSDSAPSLNLWNASTMSKDIVFKVNASDFSDSERIDGTLHKELLHRLYCDGVVMVEGMPDTMDATEQIIRNTFGPPRETFYGGMWDTAPKDPSQVNDTAYTKEALHVHTDTCYLEDCPGLQLFNCVAQSTPPPGTPNPNLDGAIEGATRLLDGFKVVDILRQEHPATYEYFTKTALKWICIEEGTHVVATGVPIKLDPITGQLQQFQYNTYDLAPIDYMNAEESDLFYHHNRVMCDVMRSKDNIMQLRLEVGEMIVVNNHRVCHGRNAFTGYRNMVGCYLGKDDWLSKLRVVSST